MCHNEPRVCRYCLFRCFSTDQLNQMRTDNMKLDAFVILWTFGFFFAIRKIFHFLLQCLVKRNQNCKIFPIFVIKTLARTLFAHPRTHMGGCNPPCHFAPNWERTVGKDQTNPWDVLSPTVPELTSLGQILTPLGRVKVKKWFEDLLFFTNNFQTKKYSGII